MDYKIPDQLVRGAFSEGTKRMICPIRVWRWALCLLLLGNMVPVARCQVTWRVRRTTARAASPARAGEIPSPLAGSSLMVHSFPVPRILTRVKA